MATLLPSDQLYFVHGFPEFDFDECYAGFENNDSLYRLVNTKTREWAFYNDSSENVVRVKAKFGEGSKVVALGDTRLAKLPPPAPGSDAKAYECEAFLEIGPAQTKTFVKGVIQGYVMEFFSESAPAEDVEFNYRVPSLPYDKIYKCFKDKGNGLLFRLVDERRGTWAFYNDTADYVMKVSVDFPNKGEVTPLNGTKVAKTPSSSPNGVVFVIEIKPGETQTFISGKPTSYKFAFAAEPVANLGETDITFLNGHPDPAIVPNQSHVFRCFKEHSNGLLFRIVDDVNRIWAFYNDTTDLLITVNARLPATEAVQIAPGVRISHDDDGVALLSVEIPPLATVPFFIGEPKGIEMAFAATPVRDPEALDDPPYENGAPDPAVIQPDVVHKCFKEHGNGLLFRLKDSVRQRWGFYNDTTDNVMTVKVAITEGENIRPLGTTRVVEDPDMGEIYTLEVGPLRTVLFIEGVVHAFTSRFSAARVMARQPSPAG